MYQTIVSGLFVSGSKEAKGNIKNKLLFDVMIIIIALLQLLLLYYLSERMMKVSIFLVLVASTAKAFVVQTYGTNQVSCALLYTYTVLVVGLEFA